MFFTCILKTFNVRVVANYFRGYSSNSYKSINFLEPSVQKYFNHLLLENEMLLMKHERNDLEIKRLREIKLIVSVLAQRMYLKNSITSLKYEHASEQDEDVQKMMQEELEIYRKRAKETDNQLHTLLMEPFLSDSKILVELVASEGDGAKLFTKELFHLYKVYAKYKNWRMDVASTDEFADGFKRVSMLMEGVGVREMMHIENGVHHRISDANELERISTVSVSIMDQPTDSKEIPRSELIVETKEASGVNGDSDGYVCITHTPTGILLKCKEYKSSKVNEYIALKELHTLLYNKRVLNTEKQEDKGPIQSDIIIRTYDHSRDRVLELREGVESQHRLATFMQSGEHLELVQESLLQHHHYQTLINEIKKFDKKQNIDCCNKEAALV